MILHSNNNVHRAIICRMLREQKMLRYSSTPTYPGQELGTYWFSHIARLHQIMHDELSSPLFFTYDPSDQQQRSS
jgi:hypothetical protein